MPRPSSALRPMRRAAEPPEPSTGSFYAEPPVPSGPAPKNAPRSFGAKAAGNSPFPKNSASGRDSDQEGGGRGFEVGGFEVRGFATDPKHSGYQILTNYESTYWRAFAGVQAWSLYEVLRSF